MAPPTHLGMFPLLLKRTAYVMASRLSVIFRRLVRLCSTRLSGDTPIYLPNSERSIVLLCCKLLTDKVFERLVSVCLGRFMEHSGVIPSTQFAYRKCLGTSDAILYKFPFPLHCKVHWACA